MEATSRPERNGVTEAPNPEHFAGDELLLLPEVLLLREGPVADYAVVVADGTFRQVAILLGLIAGTAIAVIAGVADLRGAAQDTLIAVRTTFPFAIPNFGILAALPLLIFSVVAMNDATGQTVARRGRGE